MSRRNENKKLLKCPGRIILIVLFTISISLLELGEGIVHIHKEKEGFQYFIQVTWMVGRGNTAMIVGIGNYILEVNVGHGNPM